MKWSAEKTHTGLAPIQHSEVVNATPNGEITGMELGLVDALQDHYRGMGFGYGDDRQKFHSAIGFIADPGHADVKNTLQSLVARLGRDPDNYFDLQTYLLPLQIAAFDRTYVEHAVETVLSGRELSPAQHANQAKTLDLVQSHLITDVQYDDSTYKGPRHHYPELSHTVWTGRRTALRDELHDEARMIHDIHKSIRPAIEHPTIRAVSLAADIADRIEGNRRFNFNDLRRLSQEVDADVAPGVRRYSKTADQIFTAFIGQTVERHMLHVQQGNAKKALIYEQILDTMRVKVEIVAKFSGPATPAEAFGAAEVDDILQQELHPDTAYGQGYIEPVVEVFTDPKKSKHQRAKVTVMTSAAVVTLSTAFLAGHMPDNSSELSASEGRAIFTVPMPSAAENSKGTTVATAPAPSEVAATDTPLEAIPLTDDIDLSVVPELQPPTTAENNHNTDRPTAQDIKNIGALPVVEMIGQPTTHIHAPETTTVDPKDHLKNFDYNGTFPQAVEAYTETYLKQRPDAAPASDLELAVSASSLIEKLHGNLKQYYGAGKLNQHDYEASNQLLIKAAVAGEYPGLIKDMSLDNLVGNAYTDALAKHYINTSGNLGTSTDVPTLEAVSLAIASAIEIITPKDQQTAYLGSVGIGSEIVVETEATPEDTTEQETVKNDAGDTGTQDQGDKGTDKDKDKDQDTGTKQDDNTSQGENANHENDTNANENEDNSESKYSLSEAEKSALSKMEKLGTEWHNRALVLRGLMERGRTAMAASAIIGNASVEAAGPDLNPAITQIGGGPGRGIIQWEVGGRFGAIGETGAVGTLVWYAAEHDMQWSDLEAQIGFIDWELRNTEGAAGVALAGAKTVAEATEIFVRQYERPADPDASLALRTSYANGTFAKFHDLLDEVQKSNESENESSEVHQNNETQPENNPTDTVPLNPEQRVSYLAENLDIPEPTIRHSIAYSGINHFYIDEDTAVKMLDLPAKGGYPTSLDTAAQGSIVDEARMYSRECVSYAAWRVSHDRFKGAMPTWGGNDNQPGLAGVQAGNAMFWPGNGRADGYRVDLQPSVGSVIAWEQNGAEHNSFGHVAYVDKVLGDGSVVVSQYNTAGDGEFSVEVLTPPYLELVKDQISFIHFEDEPKHNEKIVLPEVVDTTEEPKVDAPSVEDIISAESDGDKGSEEKSDDTKSTGSSEQQSTGNQDQVQPTADTTANQADEQPIDMQTDDNAADKPRVDPSVISDQAEQIPQ